MLQCPKCGSSELKKRDAEHLLCGSCGANLRWRPRTPIKACPMCGSTESRPTFACPSCGRKDLCESHRIEGRSCSECACTWCRGTGLVACPFCNNGSCHTCFGRAKIPCDSCDGSGRSGPGGLRTCKTCKGTKIVPCDARMCKEGKCTSCGGTGKKKCDACEGRGYQTKERE